MTKEEFFEIIEDRIKKGYKSFLCCYKCNSCPYKVNLKKTNCFFTIDYKYNIEIPYRDFRYKNIMKEYEMHKAEMLIEKLK